MGGLLHLLADVGGDAAEIASLRCRIDVDHRADVVMRDDSVAGCPLDRSQATEQLRGCACGRGDRYVFQPAHCAETARWRLDRDWIGNPRLGIEPVGRRSL